MVALCVGACGGSSSDTDDDPGLALEEVPEAYASVFCDLTNRCNPFFKAFIPVDDCTEFFVNTLNNQNFDNIIDAVEDHRAIYNADKMRDCLDQIGARSCDELTDPDPESCEQAAEGTVERGGDCTTDIECEGVSICKFSDSCPGTCEAKLNAGESCSGDDQCEEGLDCSEDTDRCVAPAEEGEDCGGGVAPDCNGDTLFCLGDDEDESVAGTCRPADEVFSAKPGETCDFEEGPLCETGSACVVSSIAPLTLECAEVVEAGEDCQFGLPNACEPGAYCADVSIALLDVEGTCKPYADPGDECDPTALFMCGLGASCQASDSVAHCVANKANGVSCEEDSECWSDNCVDGGCAPEGACED